MLPRHSKLVWSYLLTHSPLWSLSNLTKFFWFAWVVSVDPTKDSPPNKKRVSLVLNWFFLRIFYCPCLVSFCLATAPHGLLILPLLTITLQLLPFCQLRLYNTLAVVMPPALMGSTSTTSTSSPSTKIRLATIKFYSPNATHTWESNSHALWEIWTQRHIKSSDLQHRQAFSRVSWVNSKKIGNKFLLA